MMPTYVPPVYPFPWPKDLSCGEPYINWPTDRDIFSSTLLNTEVAVPESWVEIGNNGVNKTKEAYSLVLTTTTSISKDTRKIIPMYRNKPFETSDDEFFDPDSYYLEYLGAPSLSSTIRCDMPYHMLSYQYTGSPLANYKLAHSEGKNFMFHLYSGDTEKEYSMRTREPLAKTGLLQACAPDGKNVEYIPGKPLRCLFREPETTPTPMPSSNPSLGNGREGVNLGLAVGLPVGFLAVVGLGFLVVAFVPGVKERLRREGLIRI
ncbi:hypothetical protein B0J11DRAFT_535734 [Dendryphion nanum]|uniref:Uncharacterized protein n=1 Tax=Dendryphion nanum TaxID=256645 RepID=A0A9P9DGR9_9PLEO|nr:hypothetical protein B0J11DRAFT_535734 [Dendryphion nanum]